MKKRINLCLTQEEVEILTKKAEEQGLSKSSMIGKLITQEGHITQSIQIQNGYTPNPLDGYEGMTKEELRAELHLFYKKIDHSLTEDRQELANMIEEDHKTITKLIKSSHPDGE